MSRIAPVLALAFLVVPVVAHADKAPPPSRKVRITTIETGPCERDGKAIDCPKEARDAAATTLVALVKGLRVEPIRCGYGPALTRELHMYWGDGFGSVVDIDFEEATSPLPECASRVVQRVADGLTEAFKAHGDKDALLRVHWTVAFTLR